MSAHTPGPWLLQASDKWRDAQGNVVQYGEYLISVGSRDERDEAYYRIARVSNVNDSPANEANARLIAAAPELLAALREAEAGLEFAGADKEPPTEFVPSHTLALRNVRAAIAKATGSTHV